MDQFIIFGLLVLYLFVCLFINAVIWFSIYSVLQIRPNGLARSRNDGIQTCDTKNVRALGRRSIICATVLRLILNLFLKYFLLERTLSPSWNSRPNPEDRIK